MKKGLFITFEGIDGTGKSTQIELLHDWLKKNHPDREVVFTREPGGTESGQKIREVILFGKDVNPRADMFLYAADRAIHVDSVIEPALKEGKIVISDRYVDSSIAYQGSGSQIDKDMLIEINKYATKCIKPDLTILLDFTYEQMMKRLHRQLDNLENRASDFFDRTREEYLKLAESEPDRWLVINADDDIDAIHNKIIAGTEKLFAEK